MPGALDFGQGPAIAVLQPGGRVGGIVPEAFSQEGISVIDRPIEELMQVLSASGPRLAVVIGAPVDPAARAYLRQWVNGGGSAILLWCDQWPADELRDWFGLERRKEDVEGGYLWPVNELAI